MEGVIPTSVFSQHTEYATKALSQHLLLEARFTESSCTFDCLGIALQTHASQHVIQSISLISELRAKDHSILLMMDANSIPTDDVDLQLLWQTYALSNLHHRDPAPLAYIGSGTRRIDYMLGCPQVLALVHRSGLLSYCAAPQSDHRGLFADINLHLLLGFIVSPLSAPSAATRLLKAGNPVLVATYVDSAKSYYDSHKMCDLVNHHYNTFHAMPRETIRMKLEAWDADQGRAMLTAEKTTVQILLVTCSTSQCRDYQSLPEARILLCFKFH